MNFVEELRWRGMIHDIMPGTEEYLSNRMGVAYVGIDPTADSLHIGHLVGVMMLKHFQACGHKPLALIGGATGMIGDPSGRSAERNLLDEDTLRHNQNCLQIQLMKFLDFDSPIANAAEIVNNYDWMKEQSFLGFIRDVGKHITVNYMMAKDAVRKRIEGEAASGLSFTEFTYQLVQGYDFLHLYRTYNCRLQLGGSDQWGNITTGTELIRRIEGGEAYALTCPLITKSDGGKFGKTEEGNVWLNPSKTSPYKFYQFWLNTSDEDADRYLRIFTLLGKDQITELSAQHNKAPHMRLLQRELARQMTIAVHSENDFKTAAGASEILFGKETGELLKTIDEAVLLNILEGVPVCRVSKTEIEAGIPLLIFLADKTSVFGSRADARRMLKEGGVFINKQKIADENLIINSIYLLQNSYILVQKGKKNYFLVIAE